MLLLAPSLPAQDEDAIIIEEKKLDEKQKKDFPELLQPEINIEQGIDIEQEIINVEFPQVEILKEMNNQKFLLPLLRDENPWIRAAAAKALGEIGDQKVVSPLSKSLEKDKNPYVRYSAARALGEIGGRKTLPRLEKAFKREKDSWVRRAIRRSIAKIKRAPKT